MSARKKVTKSPLKRTQSKHPGTVKLSSTQDKKLSLANASKATQEAIFVRKLKLSSVTYDFSQTATNQKEKQAKYETLKELIDFATEEHNLRTLSEDAYVHVIDMVTANIFRPLPPKERTDFDPEYDLEAQDASWPHLCLVYEFFLHFTNSAGVNSSYLKKIVDRSFITKLLETFNSEDLRERQCLKCVLATLYLKFFEQRAFIRKHMRNVFLKYIYEEEQFNGIGELLEILRMAINGFNVPLKLEHKEFLVKVLVPLHKPRYVPFYQRALIECLKGYMTKDEATAEAIITGILKFWPRTCSEKEVMFLQEIGELSEVITNRQFVKIREPLMKQISKSISSLHFQVAEASLNLWEIPAFIRLVNENLNAVMPIVLPELRKISKKHWNKDISELAKEVLRSFKQKDPVLFNHLVASYKVKPKKKKERIEKPQPIKAKQ